MYIKILVYIIDNQQFKLKISILFFGSLVVFRSHLPPLLDWGGRPQKRQPGRGDFGEVVRPAYNTYPHIFHLAFLRITHHPSRISPTYPYMSVIPTYPKFYYICDIIKT